MCGRDRTRLGSGFRLRLRHPLNLSAPWAIGCRRAGGFSGRRGPGPPRLPGRCAGPADVRPNRARSTGPLAPRRAAPGPGPGPGAVHHHQSKSGRAIMIMCHRPGRRRDARRIIGCHDDSSCSSVRVTGTAGPPDSDALPSHTLRRAAGTSRRIMTYKFSDSDHWHGARL